MRQQVEDKKRREEEKARTNVKRLQIERGKPKEEPQIEEDDGEATPKYEPFTTTTTTASEERPTEVEAETSTTTTSYKDGERGIGSPARSSEPAAMNEGKSGEPVVCRDGEGEAAE